ncbi:MAG: HD domain-containing protein [Oscillospiraceae bacterium]|nr:HD domain-containing protein [Oscillospiraceae bacterium]
MDFKLIKDPLYGYVKIREDYVHKIIDTAVFQRLRRIVQTSYSPLFPSSEHNRFAHSIGVFHLGGIAAETLLSEFCGDDDEKRKKLDKVRDVFLLSCLLHDVGHAPFSHTGEQFFPPGEELNKTLMGFVKSDKFEKDIVKIAAKHEIMSAIVGIKYFGKDFLTEPFYIEFFARCITGYTYSNKETDYGLYNCFISLLKSEVIDVDRLDYLLRDAFFTGFDTTIIDYRRLLTHITFCIPEGSDTYEIGYYKGALSVIENFVYAHDSERKWIQNHPCVQYEAYLIHRIIMQLDDKLSGIDKKLFSLESIGLEWQKMKNGDCISLLCDDDIISYMKRLCDDPLSAEYFSREKRRRALWKTEAEYIAYRPVDAGDLLKKFNECLTETAKYLRNTSAEGFINDDSIDKLSKETELIEQLKFSDNINTKVADDSRKALLETHKLTLKTMKWLSDCSKKKGGRCDFVILAGNPFLSGFNKKDFSNINIVFGKSDGKKVEKFTNVVSTLKGGDKPNSDNKIFHIYCERFSKEKFDVKEFISDLLRTLL